MYPTWTVVFLLLGSLASGWALVSRLFRERERWLVASLTPLVALFIVLLLANWRLPPLLCLVPLAALLLPSAPARESMGLGKGWRRFLGAMSLLIFGYTNYAERRFVDGDSWIHDPLIASYMQGIFPPHNPFFPDLLIHGHYGRDLLIAALTPTRGSPTLTMWLLVPCLQVATFLGLFSLVRRFTGSALQAGLASGMIFFGVDVGFRVGWIDSWDSNHPIVNAGLVLCLYLMDRVFEGSPLEGYPQGSPSRAEPLFWVVAGTILGLYQVVYETYFGVLLLTGLLMGLLFHRRLRAWVAILAVAVIALALALIEGGTMTEMAHRQTTLHDTSYLSESQQVSVHFPKAHLFQVAVTTAGYQRISAAYQTRLFRGWAAPPTGSGYMSIFDRRFLTSHWLPVYLAPFTLLGLVWVGRRRPGFRMGIGLWIFGACAYLVPGLIDFGEVWEWEYFRWEMAAGVGFAGSLGVALGMLIESLGSDWGLRASNWSLAVNRRAWVSMGCLAVLVASLAAGEKILGDALIDVQQHPWSLTFNADRWLVKQPEFGLQPVDVVAMAWLRQRSQSGQRLLTNLGSELPEGIWPDVEISTRTLTLPAGHAFPSRSEAAHAHPPYQWDALRRAFWQTGHAEILASSAISWLYVDPSTLPPAALAALASGLVASQEFQDESGHRRLIFEVPHGAVSGRLAGSSRGLELELSELPPNDSLRVATCSSLTATLHNPTRQTVELGSLRSHVLNPDGSDFGEAPLVVGPPEASLGADQSVSVKIPFVTPLDEGDFQLEVALLDNEGPPLRGAAGGVSEVPGVGKGPGSLAAAAARSVPISVSFLTRVRSLLARVDLPDVFVSHRFYRLRVGLKLPAGVTSSLKTGDELEAQVRLRRPGGEYVWELDGIPQPLSVDLTGGGAEQLVYLQMLSPSPGPYDLEIDATEKQSRRVIPLLKAPLRINVAPGQQDA